MHNAGEEAVYSGDESIKMLERLILNILTIHEVHDPHRVGRMVGYDPQQVGHMVGGRAAHSGPQPPLLLSPLPPARLDTSLALSRPGLPPPAGDFLCLPGSSLPFALICLIWLICPSPLLFGSDLLFMGGLLVL